ncbi:SMC-Scp complex subunit ScpB [Acidipila sp. EB88]|uniref:SMC-Scp complex subunit ScpB n=1 Tax=Acidipila sp. EB88 TaxID=2305226 RepID=UPI000F5E09DA|nr:SMC-Scp complex subunit ScpB [Acidipila sp. EB88]RRA49930.1 SMC-Scp complex subunit ScpB [Acidipila sp. EB88]
MGVRGKLEAVIYAAEEPVTLQQLAVLFGAEALEERPQANEPGAEQLLLDAVLEEPTTTPEPGDTPAEDAAEPEAAAEPGALPEGPAVTPVVGESPVSGDQDADRRAARLRDRAARAVIRQMLVELMAEYDASERGMEIREIAGGYRVATKPEYHDAVRSFAKSLKPPMKLTLQALETLAVIAYKQPVTAPEVSEIRGVDSGGVLGSLISRKLVTTAGRKQVVGRPILYKTTKEFLLRFGLKDLAELPSMEEFEKMAGELHALDSEPAGEAMAEPAAQTEQQALEERQMESAGEGQDAREALAGSDGGLNAPAEGQEVAQVAGERPLLAPSEIVIAEEELELPGLSVDVAGAVRTDVPSAAVKPDENSGMAAERAGE